MPKLKTNEELLQEAIKDWQDMANKYSNKAVKQLNKIARLEVWRWYKSYSPKKYNRKRTLYSAFKITGGNGKISIDLGPEEMYKIHFVDKQDPSYIYINSFVEGFHGGAIDGEGHPNPGIPYWRKPEPDYPYWGMPAIRSSSPYDSIKNKFSDYEIRIRNNITKSFQKKILPKVIKALNN